jgi:hypothetical protein
MVDPVFCAALLIVILLVLGVRILVMIPKYIQTLKFAEQLGRRNIMGGSSSGADDIDGGGRF